MREALAVLSVLLGAVALTVALVVFQKNYDTGGEDQNIQNSVIALEGRIEALRKKVDELAAGNAELTDRLVRAQETLGADPAKLAKERIGAMLHEEVKKAVKQEMDARLKEARDHSGSAPAATAAAKSQTDEDFDKMCAALAKATGASADEKKKLDALLNGARQKFRDIWGRLRNNPAERDKQMAQARTDLENGIKGVLGGGRAKQFDAWKKDLKDDYSKRFFGIQ